MVLSTMYFLKGYGKVLSTPIQEKKNLEENDMQRHFISSFFQSKIECVGFNSSPPPL